MEIPNYYLERKRVLPTKKRTTNNLSAKISVDVFHVIENNYDWHHYCIMHGDDILVEFPFEDTETYDGEYDKEVFPLAEEFYKGILLGILLQAGNK